MKLFNIMYLLGETHIPVHVLLVFAYNMITATVLQLQNKMP
jgi:hypothetical protein